MKAIILGFLVFGFGMNLSASTVSQPVDTLDETLIVALDTYGYDFDYDFTYVSSPFIGASELVVPFMGYNVIAYVAPTTSAVPSKDSGLFPLPRSGLRCTC